MFQVVGAQEKRAPIWEARLQYGLPIDTAAVEVLQNVDYQEDSFGFTRLDIYRPKNWALQKPLPIVFLIHGGPIALDIGVTPKEWKLYADYGKLMASKGMAVVVFI
jgi:acetyl esterase/lipase